MNLVDDLASQLARTNNFNPMVIGNQIRFWLEKRGAVILSRLKTMDVPTEVNVIMYTVSEITGVPLEKILSRNRKIKVKTARHIICYLLMKQLGMKPEEVANHLDRERTTMYNSYGWCEARLTDGGFRNTLNRIIEQLNNLPLLREIEQEIVLEQIWTAVKGEKIFTSASHIQLAKQINVRPGQVLVVANKYKDKLGNRRKTNGYIIDYTERTRS